jgi:PAS domain S-box-containing protein
MTLQRTIHSQPWVETRRPYAMTHPLSDQDESPAQPPRASRMSIPSPSARISGSPPHPANPFQAFADNVPIQGEQEYRMIAEAIPQIVWTARPDGYNDYFNQRWFEYTGLSTDETYDPVNQGWPDYRERTTVSDVQSAVHPEDFNNYIRRWKEALSSGKSYEIEYRFRRASDGTYRWHLGRAVPIRDSDAKIIKWFGTCTDIHDQKLAEERMHNINKELERKVEDRTRELQEAREKDTANLQRLKEIIQNLPMGAIALDENDAILHFNDQFSAMFKLGVSQAELVGLKGTDLRLRIKNITRHPDLYMHNLENVIAKRKTLMGEEIQFQDGRVIARDYMPIFDGETYRGYLLLYRDVTQEKRIDASKSEFMSLASHQLRTPLTTIRWTFGRLERKIAASLGEAEKHLIQEGRKAAIRMADTIDTMLAISRIEAGKVKLDISHVLICKQLQELIGEFQEEQARKHQTVTFDCPSSLEVQTDGKFLREILFNLLSNAYKYTPDKGTIAVSLRDREQDVVVEIRDSGYGIPAHQQEKIFSKFFRGDNVLQHDTNGTGLGLYLVFLLTRILRGTVTFTSQEGKGTVFTLTLPKSFYSVT